MNRGHDDFVLTTPDNPDEDGELELEPPDPEVLAAEERRAKQSIHATHAAIDIDEIYREVDHDRSREILEDWAKDFRFRFRFQVKHLLIATAVLAIILTLYKLGALGTVMVILVMASVISLYVYLQLQERKQQQEADRRRQEMYARRRAFLENKLRPPSGEASAASAAPLASVPSPIAADDEFAPVPERPQFRFHFSMLELMAAMTVAAVVFALVHLLGGPSNAATVLGFLALFGLVVHALGFEPLGIVVLGWWLTLVLYVLLSVFAVVWHGIS
jgi:hypothetical protein